jgi:hypothetical protein
VAHTQPASREYNQKDFGLERDSDIQSCPSLAAIRKKGRNPSGWFYPSLQ